MSKRVDASEIRRIIDRTILTIEDTRKEVYFIVENSRDEVQRIREELRSLNDEIAHVILAVDDLERKDKLMRQRLVAVSRDFSGHGESAIKEAYDKASEIRLQYFVKQHEEKSCRERRVRLEQALRTAQTVLESAERLINQVGVAMNYLSGDLSKAVLNGTDDRVAMGIRVLEAREEERRRISRDMHDGPAQSMANIVLKAEICKALMARDVAKGLNELEELKGTVRETLKEIRKIIYDLRPMSLDDLGLVPTVRRFVQEYTDETGLVVDVHIEPVSEPVESIVQLAVFRLIQEILNNIRKHAAARKCVLELSFGSKHLKLVVRDDGVGFDPKRAMEDARIKGNSFGLLGIFERVEQLQGAIEYKSAPGAGTCVEITIPVNREVMLDAYNAHANSDS